MSSSASGSARHCCGKYWPKRGVAPDAFARFASRKHAGNRLLPKAWLCRDGDGHLCDRLSDIPLRSDDAASGMSAAVDVGVEDETELRRYWPAVLACFFTA